MKTIVYQGSESRRQMGLYVFLKGVPQEVPDELADNILRKPVQFSLVKKDKEGNVKIAKPRKSKVVKTDSSRNNC